MIRYFFLLVFSCLPFLLFSQQGPVLQLVSFRYDFGKVLETNGPLRHDFPVRNTGDDTLVVQKVKTSSMNVSGEMLPSLLAPGQMGVLQVTFNPRDEEGKVEKRISIRSNDKQYPIRQLSIFAEVMPREKTILDDYPVVMGHLRAKARHLAMDQLKNTETRTDTFFIYNAWDRAMSLAIEDPPSYTSWEILPPLLPPAGTGKIVLRYNAGLSGKWGLDMDIFQLKTNDSLEKVKSLSLGVNIMEHFTDSTGTGKLPVIDFEALTHDFGTLRQGESVKYSFRVTNKGDTALVIRKTKASCGCTLSSWDKGVIEPGEGARLEVTFSTLGLTGKQAKIITVISNDPRRPIVNLSISANVID